MRAAPRYQDKAQSFLELSLRKKRRNAARRKRRNQPEVSQRPSQDNQPVLPTYNPSTYHSPQSSIHSAVGARMPLTALHLAEANRSSYVSVQLPPPPPPPLPPLSRPRFGASHDRAVSDTSLRSVPPPPPPPPPPPLPTRSFSRRLTEFGTRSRPNPPSSKPVDSSAVPNDTRPSTAGSAGPKRPKPTLARLITNI
jgi:hypothetical protein